VVKKVFSVLIGEQTAEDVKRKLGSAMPFLMNVEGSKIPIEVLKKMKIEGFHLQERKRVDIEIDSDQVREWLSGTVQRAADALIKECEKTKPEVHRDICQQGIAIAGGGSLLHRLDEKLTLLCDRRVKQAVRPLVNVALGGGMLLNKPFASETVCHSRDDVLGHDELCRCGQLGKDNGRQRRLKKTTGHRSGSFGCGRRSS